MDLELLQWGDGTIRLTYEDSIHGKDRIFVLNADGTAHEAEYHGDDELFIPIDLVSVLRGMLTPAPPAAT